MTFFEIVGPISNIETIAKGVGVRDRSKLNQKYGHGKWRKLKGWAHVKLSDGTQRFVEVHWYEAHGIGKKDHKIKRFLD